MILLLLPLILIPLFLFKWLLDNTSSSNQPPSPRKLPILGNLHQLGSLPHRSLQALSRKHGPVMLLHLGSVPVLIASSANAAREIMKTHDLIFSNRPKLSIPRRLFYGTEDGSKEIAFSQYGDYWRQVRSICVLHLLSNKRVQSFRHVREEEVSLLVKKFEKLCYSTASPPLVNLTEEFNLLTNNVVCRVALGGKYSDGERGKKFKLLLGEFSEVLGTFNIGDYIPWLTWVNKFNGLDARVEKVHKDFDGFIEGVLQEHRMKPQQEGEGKLEDGGGSSDLVDILLQEQRKSTLGFPLQDETIKALLWDMFAAGTDTVSSLLEWTMVELLRNPTTLHKLQTEVRQSAKGKAEEICEDDVVKMHYLKAVIKETLRLHAPIPLLIPREATQDIQVLGYDIKAGTRVFINAWAIGRDASSWENPQEFRPERFLNNRIDFKGQDYEFIPFGGGRRGCPGITFGIAVNELALAMLVNRFDFSLPDGLEGKDMDMTESSGLGSRRKMPLVVVPSPCNVNR